MKRAPGIAKGKGTTTGTQEVVVTFTVGTETAPTGLDEAALSVVGDFNGWDPGADPLTRRAADGARVATVVVPAGRRYAFRYLGEDGTWFNDEAADAYEPNQVGGHNSILDLTDPGTAPGTTAPAMAPG